MQFSRLQVECTIAYCVLFIGLGLMPSIVGPTLPALSNVTGVDGPSDLVPAYIARGVGYGAGTMLMGAAIDQTGQHAHELLCIWQISMAVFGALLPHAGTLPILVVLVTLMNFAGGCVDVMGNVLLVKVWDGDDTHGAPAMNLLHAAWSTGSTCGPLLARLLGLSAENLSRLYFVSAVVTIALSIPVLRPRPPRIHLSTATSAMASTDAASEATSQHEHRNVRHDSLQFYFVMALMFCFYTCLGAAERIPGDWLTTAIIRSPYLHQDGDAGAFATATFFASHLAGRLLSVPLAWCIPPVAFCAIEFGLALSSSVALVVLAPWDYSWLLVSVTGLGLGISVLYPQGLLLAKSRVPLSSVWISRLAVGALVGAVLGPPSTGALLESSPNMLYWVVSLVVVVQTICFGGVLLLPRRHTTPTGDFPKINSQECCTSRATTNGTCPSQP